jgi:error-prone DNA polymerase
MSARERTAADLRGMGLTVGPHPLAHERARLARLGVRTAAELAGLRSGSRVSVAGLCIVRQRPGSAKGFVFLSLEDETGIANVIVDPDTYEQNRIPILASALLLVEGRLERSDGVTSVKGRSFQPVDGLGREISSRDFR